MDILETNHINTTTQFTFLTGGTGSVENILVLDDRYQWVSSGLASDVTVAVFSIAFSETVTIDRIALKGINWKTYYPSYNTGLTKFVLENGNTITSMVNSESSQYLKVNSINCTSVTFIVSDTIVADQEKALGYMYLGRALSTFGGRTPSAQKYRPIYRNKKVIHELSDGSYRSQVFDRKLGCDIQLDFVTTSVRNELKDIFDSYSDIVFAPFGTTTGWDGIIFPAIWANDFEFFEVTDNNAAGGHSGSIKFLETKP